MTWIGIGNTIWRRGGGSGATDWEAYWASLISATVENAAPTNVVLTFPTAQPTLTDTDFTIAGFTISSASWTGAVLTLVLSRAVTYFDDAPVITFVTTGGTTTVTNNVADDGNTEMYNWIVPITNITKDISDNVSSWKDILSVKTVANTADFPKYSTDNGIRFGGTGFLYKANFSWNLPISLFVVVKVNSWADSDIIFGGGSNLNAIRLTQQSTVGKVIFYNGSNLAQADLVNNVWHVISAYVAADGSASFQVDNNSPITGNAGTTNPVGFSIGAREDGFAKSDVDVLGFVLRKNADTSNGALIKAALQNKLAFFLT